jgi:hypothetical protein
MEGFEVIHSFGMHGALSGLPSHSESSGSLLKRAERHIKIRSETLRLP